MDNPADTLDADKAILTYTVSDEAIEAAAGIERMSDTIRAPMCRDTLLVVTCPSLDDRHTTPFLRNIPEQEFANGRTAISWLL